MINKLKFLLLILIAPLCLAQTGAHRISQVLVKGNSINANVGPFAHILVCVANTGCNTGANIYSDQALTQLITQPLVADGSGNYDYYVAIPGCYDEQISSPGSQDIFIPNVCPFNGTGGANLTAGAVQFAPTVSTTRAATSADIGNLFTGTSPCFLNKNGSCSSSTATPAGSTLQVQANIGGSFGVIPFFTINTSNDAVAARALNGLFNTDTYNTSNNGIATYMASTDCNALSCSAAIPPTSTDTSFGVNQAGNSTTNSAYLFDERYNSWAQYATNPLVSPFSGSQNEFSREAAYTVGSKSATQGGSQNMFFDQFLSITPGYVSSDGGCPLSCPASPYTGTAQWQLSSVYGAQNFFASEGIHSVMGWVNFFNGIGDANNIGVHNFYQGGFITGSDEGIHGLSEDSIQSIGDWVGAITTLTDPSHFVASVSVGGATQGPGRFMIDQTDTPLILFANMAHIFAPTNTAPYYGIVVFDSSTAALPVSTVQGHLVSNCAVPIQEGTLASTTCTAHSDNGGTYHVTSPTSTDMDLFCSAANYGGDMAFGAQITAVTAKDGSGNQVLTINIHRSVPATGVGAQPTMAAQGGACGSVIAFNADANGLGPGGVNTNGTVLPVIISPTAHSIGYARYSASQVWASPIINGSSIKDEDIAEAGDGDVAPGSFAATSVSRTGNVLTGTIFNGGQGRYGLANTFTDTISGCSDSSVNGNLALVTFTSPQVFTTPQTGANTTCSSGAILTVPSKNLQASVVWAAEVLDVSDHTPGALPNTMLNTNHFVTTFQPAFHPGDTIDLPPNYAVNGDSINIQHSLAQPGSMDNIVILNNNDSSFSGPAIFVQNTSPQFDNLGAIGLGGNQIPNDLIDTVGVFNSTINSNTQPFLCGICWGFPPVTNMPGMENFNPLSINNGGNVLHFDDTIDGGQWSFQFGNGSFILSMSNTQAVSSVQLSVPALIFDTPSPSTGIVAPTTWFRQCSQKDLSSSTCYDNYFNTPLTVTCVGTCGTTHYVYYMQLNNPNGTTTWGPVTDTFTGNATLTTSNYNQISCSALPAGMTATIWNYQIAGGPFGFTNIGTCTTSSGVVNDQVSPHGTPAFNEVSSLGGTLNIGEGLVNGAGQGYCFTSNSLFYVNPAAPPSSVGCISSVTAGVFSFDTTTLGNHLGTVIAGGGVGPAASTLWTSGAGAPSGACSNGSLYTSTTGTTTNILWACGGSAWVLVK